MGWGGGGGGYLRKRGQSRRYIFIHSGMRYGYTQTKASAFGKVSATERSMEAIQC